jgi:serine/threonine protein phosphatase PrpC
MKMFNRFLRPDKIPKTQNIQFNYLSHQGLVRTSNEDSYLLLPQLGTWAIADGMGGHNCGEVASAIAITVMHHSIVAGNSLTTAIEAAHRAIQEQAQKDINKEGMGTTIVALQMITDGYQIAWVGDSRAYLWRSGLKQLTKDHSYLQTILDQGLIDEETAKSHPYKNVITQALGSFGMESLQIDVIKEKWFKNDILLLCSDGLSREITDSKIETILAGDNKLKEKAELLLTEVLANGGSDNVTLILLTCSDVIPEVNKEGVNKFV